MIRPTSRDALQRAALRLFLEHGYDAVSVAAIAQDVGVSHMTFFRHFPTKESVVVGDLFDPAIAAAVASRPGVASPLARAVEGLVDAMASPTLRGTWEPPGPSKNAVPDCREGNSLRTPSMS